MITPYTYTLQRCSPMQGTYEACFALDQYLERVRPLRYAAVVHGVNTEVFLRPLPMLSPGSFDGTRVLPVCQALRHRGLPYAYVPDARLCEIADPAAFPVVLLPEVNCLSEEGAECIRSLAESGGNLVVLGQLGIADEVGTRRDGSLLEEIAGIEVTAEAGEERPFRLIGERPALEDVWFVEPEVAHRYWEGTLRPRLALAHCVDAELPPDAEVLAEFVTEDGQPTGHPAIALLRRRGRLLWFAGFPSHTTLNRATGMAVRNEAHAVFPALVEFAAGGQPALRVVHWPPPVPMRELRPVDPRYMSTFEFFPLVGDDLFMGVVTSYFREPTAFPMVLELPAGRKLGRVTEALSGKEVAFTLHDGLAQIEVEMGYDTPALVFMFHLTQ